jgi:Protein of unknown function (DUF1552)
MTRLSSKLSRRRLLTGMGAGALALPLLNRIPRAEAAGFPTRFVVFVSPNEPIEKKYWQPSNDLTLTDVMQPLQKHVEKLVLVGDMTMATRAADPFGGGHVGMGHLLTGHTNNPYGTQNAEFWAGGISVDQHIANALGVEALTLGARTGGNNGNGRISYSAADSPVHPTEDPQKAFDQILGDYTLPADELADVHAQRARVLDAVSGQLSGLKGKLGQDDWNKLEQHLAQIESLEASLGGGSISCEPTAPPGGFDYASNADYPITARRHMDVLVQALACDVTRVGSIQLGTSGAGHLTPTWPDFGIDVSVDEHNIAHDYNSSPSGTNVTRREQLERFYYEQFAYLLDQLDAVPEGDGTLLDNTLVLWGKPIGKNHNGSQMLFMLAGGAGGALQTGRYLEANDVPHNNLLLSCCQLMGLDDTSFGNPDFCTGALSL